VFFWGSLIFLCSPVYIHWVFKNAPEVYLTLLLGLFILGVVKFYRTGSAKYVVLAIFVFALAMFLKPGFIFIPLFLLIFSVCCKSRRVFVVSLFFMLLSVGSYVMYDRVTRYKYDIEVSKSQRWAYGKTAFVENAFWVDYVLRTRQFHKGTLVGYDVSRYGEAGVASREWMENFFNEHPESSYFRMTVYFFGEKPLLVLQKFVASPFFYLAMSAKTSETYAKLIFSIIAVVLASLGLRNFLRTHDARKEVILILAIIIGYSFLFLVLHAMNRYSMPILPYLYVWGGITLLGLKRRLSKSKAIRGESLFD
jgi:hypothetical protein